MLKRQFPTTTGETHGPINDDWTSNAVLPGTISETSSSSVDDARSQRPVRVTFYLFFPGGGIGRYTHELLSQLHHSSRLAIELACLPSYHWRNQANYPLWTGLREIGHARRWRRRTRFLIGQFVNPRRLCRRVRRTQADIVHFANINHLTYSIWEPALRASGVKVAATVHDVRRASSILNERYERRQLIRFYNRADALFVHSNAQALELQSFADTPRDKIHIVPHGPYDYGPPSADRETLRERYGIPPGKLVALAFGQIRDEKNLDLLIRAIRPFRDSLHLVIAGCGGAHGHKGIQAYRDLVERLGIQNSVSILYRFVPDDEVADLFEMCDWVALNYSSRFTSQSGVLNVATHYRRPSVLSATATLSETIDQCDIGVAVEPDNLGALVQGIQKMQHRLKKGHQHEFVRYAQLFGWNRNVEETIQVYQQLV